MAIETSQPLDASGLEEGETNSSIRERMAKTKYDAWRIQGRRGARFIILDQERKVDGGVLRKCAVDVAPHAGPLSDAEEASLVHSFLIERAKLIAARSHLPNDPSPIYPIVPLGLSPERLNPNGCSVISTIMFDLASDFFDSATGEQVRQKCSGPTRLDRR